MRVCPLLWRKIICIIFFCAVRADLQPGSSQKAQSLKGNRWKHGWGLDLTGVDRLGTCMRNALVFLKLVVCKVMEPCFVVLKKCRSNDSWALIPSFVFSGDPESDWLFKLNMVWWRQMDDTLGVVLEIRDKLFSRKERKSNYDDHFIPLEIDGLFWCNDVHNPHHFNKRLWWLKRVVSLWSKRVKIRYFLFNLCGWQGNV